MKLEDSLKLWKQFSSQTTQREAVELYNSVLDSPPGDVIEIGSASGGTTIVLIGAAEEVGKRVYSIDPYPEEFEGVALHYTHGIMKSLKNDFKKNILDKSWKNVTQFNEDIKDCINRIPDKLSVVFIDGCHEFSFVRKEIYLLFPRLVQNGYLYIHDTNWEVGQLTNTKDAGVHNIYEWIKNNIDVIDIKNVDSMFCCKKKE